MSKIWFITGATRGIGAELARAALAAGHSVVATGRKEEDVRRALGDSSRLLPVALDVTKPRQIEEAVRTAVAKLGRIDVLVNNAGYGLVGAVEELSAEELAAQFETNVLGLAAVTRAVAPVLRAQRAGRIFNVSSAAGIVGFPGAAAYCASKFAVEGLSESMAHELAPLGIHVTIVEPGYFRTEFLTGDSVRYAAKVVPDYDATVGAARRSAREMNGQQSGDPKKLAQAILTLAEAERPPLRFIAGADAVGALEASIASRRADLEAYRELSLSLAIG